MKYSIGIDQSYRRTGIAVAGKGKIVLAESIDFGKVSKYQKRLMVTTRLEELIEEFKPGVVIVERVRQFTGGNNAYLSMNMIKAGTELLTSICDTAYDNDVSVYSVDTRSWRKQVVGSAVTKGEDKKRSTMEFVKEQGFNVDDDASDAACIALYAFVKKENRKMRKEGW